MKTIEYGDWEDEYLPVKDKHENLVDFDPRCGEISQEEFKKMCKQQRVWTSVDCPEADGGIIILSGFHFVNRMEHYITEKPWEEEMEVE